MKYKSYNLASTEFAIIYTVVTIIRVALQCYVLKNLKVYY